MPLFHIHGIVATLLAPLLAGGSVICSAPTSSEELLGQLSALEATWLSASPTLLAALLAEQERQKRARPHHLRLLRSVTMPLPPALRQRLEAVFEVPALEVYGMTEAASQICSQPLPGCGAAHRPGSVGPAAGPEVAVLSTAGEHQPPGVIGEVAVRGPSVTSGYEGSDTSGWIEDATGVQWFQTGDEGSLDVHGHLSLIGRSKEMINRGGMKVIPRRVDEALEAHPAVLEGLAFALPHPTRGEDLAAAVVLSTDATVDATVLEQELRDHLAELLPAHEVPSRIVQVETLPRGTTGKPLRSALAEQLASSIHPISMPADGPIEQLIAAIFAAVLNQRQPAGRDDNFFLLGGDSLSSLRVIHRLEQQLDLELSPTLLFRHPSVQDLAQQLAPLLAQRGGSMSSPQSLADRVTKLRQRNNTNRSGSIPSAEPKPGGWGPGRLAFPASYAQSRLWFLQQLEPDLTAYHLPALWRLRGKLNLNALRLALADLIERHGSLRTSFCLQDSEVLQIIHPPAPFPLEEEVPGGRNVDAVVEQWLEQERTTPFGLASGRLIRARLLAVDHQHHLLLLNHHHIASDGWSLSVLARDLTELYNARRSGQASELVPLQVHYHDYAVWQRQRLSGDRLQTLKDYWIPQLTGLEPLDLPSDHPRPATPSHQGGSVSFQITAELLAPFEQLCRLEGATLQMGLLALLALLLHRYSRQDDFAIGIPIWGRNHPDLEPLIGFFINTLPIRTRFTPQQNFRQLLGQVKASSLAAYDHQELPFEQIVEALNLPRDTSRNPLVQVMLQLIELPEAALNKLDGLHVNAQSAEGNASRFELEFFLRRASGGVEGKIVYPTEIFSVDRIERLSFHLLTLFRSALAAPDAPAASLCLLPEGERLLIESWQHGPIEATPDTCVHQLFEQQVERTPDALALAFDHEQLSYFELNESANRLAHHLIDLGVGPEVIVAVCLERSPASVVSLLAVLKAGGTYLPLEPHWPTERLKEFILDSGSSISLADSEATATAFRETIQSILFPLLDLSKSPSANPAPSRCAPSQLAYILYTSGSTGKPKGIRVEHKTLNNLLHWSKHEERLSKPAKTLQYAANVFDVSLQEIFAALTTGGSLWLISESARRDFRQLYSLLLDTQIERIFMPYVALEQLSIYATAQTARGGLNLRDIISAGEALILTESIRKLLASMPDCRLHNHYGPTESHVVTAYCVEDLLGADNDEVSIGRPISNSIIYLLDSLGRPCPIGIPGELHIGGAGLARGYLNNPGLAAEKFIPDPFSSDPTVRLYKSGDLASWNPDGTLAFHGRIDQQIKLRGFRIEPGEIEAHLLSHPAVAQAVALLRHDDPNNPRLIAYWVADASQQTTPSATAEQLRAFLADRLPDYMVPAAFVALEALPLTTNGKLDRKALPAPSFSGDQEKRVAPSTVLERQLHALWAEVLGHEEFGITDSFFLVGGHSLAAARLVSRIEQSLGSAPPLAALFQNPTIAGLCALLVGTSGVAPSRAAILPVAPLSGDWPPGCEAYQASFAQARLWFLHQLEPELTAYHLPAVWRLRGDLDVPALQRALEGLIERHSTLRTSFRLEGSEVIQIVHPVAPLLLSAEALGERDPEVVIQGWLEEESRTPFDLTAGLLLRARLLRVEDQQHVLLINHHHIASDGWSRSVLARDLVEHYNAERIGRDPGHPPLPVHYPDYAAWQRQRLSGERLQELNDYWIGQLSDLEPLELPSDHPRPVTPSYRGDSVCFQIEPALLEPFEELCRREGATLQMGLLAVVALLLHRYSRQEDFAIGVPIWGRNHPDLENLIGFFINTLPIRTRFQTNQSFRDLLSQVKESSIGAYDHQELPFEQLVEALNVERDTSRNPLVQVMLQLIELPEAGLEQLDGLAVQSLPSRSDSAKLDLSFYLRRSADQGLSASITYAKDLFDGDRIERLTGHMRALLGSALEAPDAAVNALNLLPEAERQLIESWQQGPVVEVPELCVHELFEQQVERTPDAIALVIEEQQLTYRELNERANQLAHHLRELGVGPDVIVGVCLERSIELVVALLAILKAGGAYLPLDPAWPLHRLGQILEDAAPAVVISAAGLEIPCGTDRQTSLLRLGDHPLALDGRPAPNPPCREHHPRQLAYLTTTSGSTGRPKGVLIEHRGILRLLDPSNPYAISSGDRVLQLAPLSFDAATFEIWGALLNGATLVMAPPGQLSLQEMAALLRQQRITTLWLTAGLFQAMVEEQPEALASVRQILAGGDVLTPGTVQRLLDRLPAGHRLINGYGPTENTTFTCCHALPAGEKVDPGGVPIGRPIAATLVRVLDRDGHPCPIGVPGELHIGGAGLARGYLNNPRLNAESFIADPFAPDVTARLYRSGDLMSWNADGSLAFHGRNDQQIKLRGFRIEPGEIEAALLEHPSVAQAVVVLRRDDPSTPRLIAYWVPQEALPSEPANAADGAALAAAGGLAVRPATEQLRAFLAESLPDYMVPAAFVELEALPLTTNGKLDRKALPAPSFSGDLQQRVEPSTDLERQLHALWAEVLGHGEFGISDHFFYVGGHSLAAARLMALIEQHFAIALPIATIFHAPEIGLMARLMLNANATAAVGDPCLVPLQIHGEAAPLFVIHGYAGDVFCYTDFARDLAPHRPVYGLQAMGIDGTSERHRSVEAMAEHYANLIDEHWPAGVVHLLGQSAGGWYAWAVASELLRRGRSLGLVAILDSGPTAAISRRLRGSLLLRRSVRRVPVYAHQLRHSKRPRNLLAFLRERRRKLASHLSRFSSNASSLMTVESLQPSEVDEGGLDYFDLLHRRYRPGSLPVRVHLLTSKHDPHLKIRLWRAMACGGVVVLQLFEEHHHFHSASHADQLAAAIAEILEQMEQTESHDTPNNRR